MTKILFYYYFFNGTRRDFLARRLMSKKRTVTAGMRASKRAMLMATARPLCSDSTVPAALTDHETAPRPPQHSSVYSSDE